MISLKNTVTLASTKLRTRRIRLIVTLIVSGLLLMVLVVGSYVIRGSLASIADFTKDRYTNRFFVSVMESWDKADTDKLSDPSIIKRAQELDKVLLAKKTAEAKRLGIPFDTSAEAKAAEETDDADGTHKLTLNLNNPSARQAYNELGPKTDFKPDLAKIATPYGLKNIYTGKPLNPPTQQTPELNPIVDGAEVQTRMSSSFPPDPFQNFGQMAQTLDEQLVAPLALKNADLSYHAGEAVPILAPADAVEKLAGLPALGNNASNEAKLQRLKDTRAKAETMTFTVCYRNTEAIALRTQAKGQEMEIAANTGKNGYLAPSLQYAASKTPCTPTVIKSDKRSAEEKSIEEKTQQFKQEFGSSKPETAIVTFRVVGVLPKIDMGSSAADLSALLTSLTASTISGGWVVPSQAAVSHPVLSKLIATPVGTPSFMTQTGYYVELKNRETQKHFLADHACQPMDSPSLCSKEHKYFMQPYGNPLATLYDGKEGFDNFLRIVLIIIGGLTAIIMMGTIGKIIADSRKETSVFRALGASRSDIDQIYLLYALILSALAFLLAAAIGTLVALWIEHKYAPGLSIAAVLAFNSPDPAKVFHLFGFNAFDMLEILGFTLATGLLSSILPLGLNMRRNPIKDMREE